MNKAYKVIWSKAKNCYVVASELAKRHTKAPSVKGICTTVVAGVLASIISCGAVMPVAEAYTYDNQTTTVTELQADTNPTTITNHSNVTVNGDVNLPKAGSTTYSYSNNSDINLNFDLTGISTKQDAVNKLMALGNSLTLATRNGYGDGWGSAADSGWSQSTYYHDYHYSDNKSFAVHDGTSYNHYAIDDTVNRTGHDVVTGNYCIKSRWIGGGYDDAEDTFLVVQIDTTTGDILTGISEYYVTDMGGHWDDYPVASTQDFTVNTSDSSSPHLNVTSNSNLNVVGNSGSGTVTNGDITLTGGNLTTNGTSNVLAKGDVKATTVSATNSVVKGKSIVTTGAITANNSEVKAVQTAVVSSPSSVTLDKVYCEQAQIGYEEGSWCDAETMFFGSKESALAYISQQGWTVASDNGNKVTFSGGWTTGAYGGAGVDDVVYDSSLGVWVMEAKYWGGETNTIFNYHIGDSVNVVGSGTTITETGVGENIQASSIKASNGSKLSAKNIKTTSGDLDATGSEVTATETVQSAGVVKAGVLKAPQLLGAGSGMSTLGGGLTVAGQVKGVTAGTADTDAVNLKQMRDYVAANAGSGSGGATYTAGNGITINDSNVISAKAGTNVTVNSNGINVTGNGSVASGNTGLISGGTAYSELRPTTNGSFVKSNQTTAQNLTALDTATKGAVKGISANGSTLTLTKGDGTTSTVTLQDNDTKYTAGNGLALNGTTFSAKAGTNVTIDSNGINVVGNGTIASGNTGLVTGGTVYNALQNIDVSADGTITSGNTKAISGGTAYSELRPATNGSFVKSNQTTAQNLTALDTATKNGVKDLSVNGRTITITKGDGTTSTITTQDNDTKYTAGNGLALNGTTFSAKGGTNVTIDNNGINVVGNGTVASGNTGLVSGGTAYTELRPADGSYVKKNQTTAQNLTALDVQTKANSDAISNLGNDMEEQLATKANVGLDNITDDGKAVIRDLAKDAVKVSAGTNVVITANAEGNATSYQVDVEGTGKIKANDAGLISGGTAYTELRPVDGNYVQQNNTTAQNLATLDEQLKGAYDAIDQAGADTDAALATKADRNANNLTGSDVDAWQRKLGDGTIGGDNDTGLVTGSTVKQALTDLNNETDAKLDLKANADASNVSQFAQEWADAIGTGTVSADDTRLVTGKTVYEAMHDAEGTMDIKEINVKNLKAEYINVDEIEGDHATFNTIDAKEINTTDLNAENINTTNLTAEDIKTNTFEAIDGKIDHLQSTDIKTETLEATQKIKTKDFEATGLTELNRLNVNGIANFKDNVNIEKDLTVKGDTLLKGDLTVEGTTDLQDTTVNGILTVNGDEKVNGNQEVTGKSTVGSQEVLGDSVIDGNQYIKGGLKVDEPSEFGGKVTTHDDVEVGKDLLVNGDARIKGDTTMEGDTEVQGDFCVEGDTNLKDTLVDGTLKVTGEATFDDKVTAQVLEVLGDATVDGSQSIKENLTVEGKTELKGDVRTGKDVEVGRDLTVDGKSTFKDDVLMEKNLAVQGNTSMDGDLSVGGNITVEKDFTVNGQSNLKDTLVDGTLEVNKEASFHDNVLIDKHLGVAGSGIFGGDLSVGGNGNIAGTFDIGQDLTVEGTSNLKGDVAMGSNADVAGNFHVGGESQLDGNTTIGTNDAPADLHVTGNAQVDKNLAVGGDTNLAGNVEIGGDLHAENGTSYFGQSIWNEGQEHQVEINQTGIRVGLNSTHMDAHGIYAGGHNWDEANAAMHEDGRIKGIYGNFEKDVVIGGKLEAGEADIKGNTNIGGNLQVAGDSNFGGNVVVQKNLAVKGDSVVGGNSYVAGDQVVNQNLQVNGNSNFAGNVLVNKNLAVKGDAVVNGTIIADNALIGGKDFNQELGRIDDKIYTAGANAAALASLAPVPTDEDTKWNLSAAVGNYHNQTAGAVGVFYKPQDNVMFNVRSSFGSSSSDNMIGGGVSVALDRGGNNGLTKQAMARKISSLEDKLKDYDAMKVALVRMQQKIDALTVNPNLTAGFPDVPEDHWANSSVSTLHGNGLVQGYPDGEFKGDRPMTRYEYAEMLCNALLKGGTVSEEHIREYAPELRQIRMNRQQAGQAIPKAIEALE